MPFFSIEFKKILRRLKAKLDRMIVSLSDDVFNWGARREMTRNEIW